MKSPFEKSTVYHSQLVAATENGPIEIKLLENEPKESKFKGRSPQMPFTCGTSTHYYQIENENCAEAMSGRGGQMVWVSAFGRAEKAGITIEDADEPRGRNDDRGSHRHQRQDDRREERQERDPHRKTPEERVEEERKHFVQAKIHASKCGVLMDVCLHVAVDLARKHFGGDMTTEDIRAISTTLFIETKGQTDIAKLPMRWLEKEPQKQERRAEPQEEPPDREERRGVHPALDESDAEDTIPF